MSFDIRPFHPSDLPALYRICLLTGDNGDDATLKYSDPELLGHYFAAPYAVFEPELCFILTHEGQPVGYVLGCLDSAEFYQKCERE
ncbi:MAG: GNAT family N-acetyltransferase, partial [Candidatus Promineifilaceae bacterium]